MGFWVVITVGRAQTLQVLLQRNKLWTWGLSALTVLTVYYITHLCVCRPLIQALVIYAKAQWKSDCDRALRRAIDCNVDNTSSFKCLGPINTTKGLGRWIQTKAFFPLIYFYFSFLCWAIRDVWPINSSIHHASTHQPPSIHSALCWEPSLSSSASALPYTKVWLGMTLLDTEE